MNGSAQALCAAVLAVACEGGDPVSYDRHPNLPAVTVPSPLQYASFPGNVIGIPSAPSVTSIPEGQYPLSGLQALYLAGSQEQADVPLLGDDTGAARVVQAASFSADPTFSATGVGGAEPGVMFSGSLSLTALVTADWTFLHQSPIYVVWRGHPTGSLVNETIATTRLNTASAEPGFALIYDGSQQRFSCIQYQADGTLRGGATQDPNGAPRNNAYTVLMVFDKNASPATRLYVSSTTTPVLVKTGNLAGSEASGAPGQPLRFSFDYGTNSNFFAGGTKFFAAYLGAPSDIDIAKWFTIAPTLASGRSQRVIRAIGDSLTVGGTRYLVKLWERACRTNNLRLEYVGPFNTPAAGFPCADSHHDGVNGNTIAQMTARVDISISPEPTDVLLLAGTNNFEDPPEDAVADYADLVDAVKVKHPNARIFSVTPPTGDGTQPGFNEAIEAFNAELLATIPSWPGVTPVNIHVGPYAWQTTDAIDGVGHYGVAGGAKIGNTVAVAMGIPGD